MRLLMASGAFSQRTHQIPNEKACRRHRKHRMPHDTEIDIGGVAQW